MLYSAPSRGSGSHCCSSTRLNLPSSGARQAIERDDDGASGGRGRRRAPSRPDSKAPAATAPRRLDRLRRRVGRVDEAAAVQEPGGGTGSAPVIRVRGGGTRAASRWPGWPATSSPATGGPADLPAALLPRPQGRERKAFSPWTEVPGPADAPAQRPPAGGNVVLHVGQPAMFVWALSCGTSPALRPELYIYSCPLMRLTLIRSRGSGQYSRAACWRNLAVRRLRRPGPGHPARPEKITVRARPYRRLPRREQALTLDQAEQRNGHH